MTLTSGPQNNSHTAKEAALQKPDFLSANISDDEIDCLIYSD